MATNIQKNEVEVKITDAQKKQLIADAIEKLASKIYSSKKLTQKERVSYPSDVFDVINFVYNESDNIVQYIFQCGMFFRVMYCKLKGGNSVLRTHPCVVKYRTEKNNNATQQLPPINETMAGPSTSSASIEKDLLANAMIGLLEIYKPDHQLQKDHLVAIIPSKPTENGW